MKGEVMKIAVAMSGGVDSSVAAVLLQKQGHEIFGVTMRHFDNTAYGFPNNKGIDAAIKDAKIVAEKLGIPHYVVDTSESFKEIVETNFIEEYAAGHTPNPCTICNPTIKWGALLEGALELGAEKIATGHYIRLQEMKGIQHLFMADDRSKDQSYMLWRLNQYQLSKTIFPIAGMVKNEVRKIASDHNLAVANKGDSQEICFIYGHYEDFLRQYIEIIPGDICLKDGKIIGQHRGLSLYTIGQRKGLNTPWHCPLYVMQLDMKKNRLIVTDDPNDLAKDSFAIRDINWLRGKAPINNTSTGEPTIGNLSVQIRYNSQPVAVKELIGKDTARKETKNDQEFLIKLENPVRAITPGQSAVFYYKNELLGGGIIK